jgi:hypothetical protein
LLGGSLSQHPLKPANDDALDLISSLLNVRPTEKIRDALSSFETIAAGNACTRLVHAKKFLTAVARSCGFGVPSSTHLR